MRTWLKGRSVLAVERRSQLTSSRLRAPRLANGIAIADLAMPNGVPTGRGLTVTRPMVINESGKQQIVSAIWHIVALGLRRKEKRASDGENLTAASSSPMRLPQRPRGSLSVLTTFIDTAFRLSGFNRLEQHKTTVAPSAPGFSWTAQKVTYVASGSSTMTTNVVQGEKHAVIAFEDFCATDVIRILGGLRLAQTSFLITWLIRRCRRCLRRPTKGSRWRNRYGY